MQRHGSAELIKIHTGMREIVLDRAEKYMKTSIFSLHCLPKKKRKHSFMSIQNLELTYNLISNCNTILQAVLHMGTIFLS